MGKLIDLTGKKFERLMVVRRNYPNGKGGQPYWLCKCDCGKENIVSGVCLREGHSRSCGCLKKENKLSLGLASKKRLIDKYKRSAKKKGYSFELTNEQFFKLTQRACYYCGIEPNNITKNIQTNGNYIYNGLDRIDNTKGYTIKNTVSCCSICNYAKRNLTLQEFKDWLKRISNKMFGEKECN